MSPAEELALLRAENARLKAEASKPKSLTLKVGQAGTVCLYGLGRFPVALYKTQWQKLLAQKEAIEKFIVDNDASLSQERGDKRVTAAVQA